MNFELKTIVPGFIVSLALIRFWIEVITTTILKNSAIINSINNNSWYHHYQLGIVVIGSVLILEKVFGINKLIINSALAFGLALFVDQYIYFLSLLGINLPFGYRSGMDYLIITIGAIGLILYWVLLKRSDHK